MTISHIVVLAWELARISSHEVAFTRRRWFGWLVAGVRVGVGVRSRHSRSATCVIPLEQFSKLLTNVRVVLDELIHSARIASTATTTANVAFHAREDHVEAFAVDPRVNLVL